MTGLDLGMRILRETPELHSLRLEVREFLADLRARGVYTPGIDGWNSGWNQEFSRELAGRGWVGMTFPTEWGGHGRSYLERFAVTEELIAAGAPVTAHWTADRQSGPSILKFGTEEQKRRYIPRIVAADFTFAIGMSEPESGSDLASVRTRGERVAGGWEVSGTKVWTSGAHVADAFLVLARTEPLDRDHRHDGLTQFIVDLRAPGVDVRPIRSITGRAHFNEVFLDQVFVPDEDVLGTPGSGWEQVTSELAFERSGPERFLSDFQVLLGLVRAAAAGQIPVSEELGGLVARLAGLHVMSRSIADMLARGEDAGTHAALVKVIGTTAEGDLAELADRMLADVRYDPSLAELVALVEASLLARPGYTLRGGTNEILRGVVARGLGMR